MHMSIGFLYPALWRLLINLREHTRTQEMVDCGNGQAIDVKTLLYRSNVMLMQL